MAYEINYKEYTRLRDIVQKRSKRLVAQGLAQPVHFPTVKEIRSGWVSGAEALEAVKGYYSGGSTLRAVKQTGLIPELKSFRVQPEEKSLSDEEKKNKRRLQDRYYRQRQRIKRGGYDKKTERYLLSYLKAERTMLQKGFDLEGFDITKLNPTDAVKFVEYLEYRFSQGDYKMQYVIDEFTKKYQKLQNTGYKGDDLKKDFDEFLENRRILEGKSTNREGITTKEFDNYWDQFIDSKGRL